MKLEIVTEEADRPKPRDLTEEERRKLEGSFGWKITTDHKIMQSNTPSNPGRSYLAIGDGETNTFLTWLDRPYQNPRQKTTVQFPFGKVIFNKKVTEEEAGKIVTEWANGTDE